MILVTIFNIFYNQQDNHGAWKYNHQCVDDFVQFVVARLYTFSRIYSLSSILFGLQMHK